MKMLVMVFLSTCSLMGQVVKKRLTEADYHLWSTLNVEQISQDKRWVSYSLTYPEGADTLFIRALHQKKVYSIAGGSEGRFSGSVFVCKDSTGQLHLLQLSTGVKNVIPDVLSFTLSDLGYLILLQRNVENELSTLKLNDLKGRTISQWRGVTQYSLSPKTGILAYVQEGKLSYVRLTAPEISYPITSINMKDYAIVWQASGDNLAYIAQEGTVLGTYRFRDQKHRIANSRILMDFTGGGILCDVSVTPLQLSDDGQKVFFGVREPHKELVSPTVEVWSTDDTLIYPRAQSLQGWHFRPKLAFWSIDQPQFKWVSDSEYPYFEILPGGRFALVYNPLGQEPQWDYEAPVDYYLKDLTTGESNCIIPNLRPEKDAISISPSGKFLAYFRDGDWWVYSVLDGNHRNISQYSGGNFTDLHYDRSGSSRICGFVGWAKDDAAVLVNDTYDVWCIRTDGGGAVRMTDGYEKGCVYRLVSSLAVRQLEGIDLTATHYFKVTSATHQGYFQWSAHRGLVRLVWEPKGIRDFSFIKNVGVVYVREHYDHPPELVLLNTRGKLKTLYQSNTQHWDFAWGFSRLVPYTSSSGAVLHGALFYPAGYDSTRHYPLIVHIYERQSDLYYCYVNPSLYNQDGFNISNLTQQGYFVLLPDIRYIEGYPGESALDCVQRAVSAVQTLVPIDSKRMGLIGHSFGGYETNFIVSQTPLFVAAVSGAGVSDVVQSYFTIGQVSLKMDSWRYEFQQFRMGIPFYSARDRYLKNSPIMFADRINTPLLLWSGKEDRSVDYHQSLALHLALRRLQKPSTFLLYKNESHALLQRDNQVDLTKRLESWWRHYLYH